MAQLTIIFSPDGGIDISKEHYPPEFRFALLNVADDLEDTDIYDVARRLAELLLEQIAR